MRTRRLFARNLWLMSAIMLMGALAILPALALGGAYAQPGRGPAVEGQMIPQRAVPPTPQVTGKFHLSITDNGITGVPTDARGGFYVVTVTNDTKARRGLALKGIDLCCSEYIRFTKVLRPGQSQTFGFYFPAGRSVTVRDIMSCRHVMRTCSVASYGRITTKLEFI